VFHGVNSVITGVYKGFRFKGSGFRARKAMRVAGCWMPGGNGILGSLFMTVSKRKKDWCHGMEVKVLRIRLADAAGLAPVKSDGASEFATSESA
jgi:hypothetical protein